jgi:hypothetical protein
MKRMYKCASALALAGLLYGADGFAQQGTLNFSDMRDGVVMTNGQVMKIRQGEATPLEDEVTLQDGTRVRADGTVTSPDGTENRLRNNRAVNERGHIVSARHDMMSYAAILRHEYEKLGEEASPLAQAVGQQDEFTLARVGRYGGFEGDPAVPTDEQIEQFQQQIQQMEQQQVAFQQHLQLMDERMMLADQLVDLTNQRLSMLERNMAAHRQIELPTDLAQLDQQINQLGNQLEELDRTFASTRNQMQQQMQDRTFGQERMTRQGGLYTESIPTTETDTMEEVERQQKMIEQQTLATQQQLQVMEEKFELVNELVEITNERLSMMERQMETHRQINLPEEINTINQQIQQIEQQLEEKQQMEMQQNNR